MTTTQLDPNLQGSKRTKSLASTLRQVCFVFISADHSYLTMFVAQGYLIGNAATDSVFGGNAIVPFAHGMGLISNDIFEVGKAASLFSAGNRLLSQSIIGIQGYAFFR